MSNELGKIGEQIALRFLEAKGYRIVEKNYRYGHGEIDIIAMDGTTLIFVEVKTRCSKKFGLPEDSVTMKKRNQLKKIAEAFIQMHDLNFDEVRFDVISIVLRKGKPVINHIENAFL